jgi:hypothetical protein
MFPSLLLACSQVKLKLELIQVNLQKHGTKAFNATLGIPSLKKENLKTYSIIKVRVVYHFHIYI